jgi:hypothetical protein
MLGKQHWLSCSAVMTEQPIVWAQIQTLSYTPLHITSSALPYSQPGSLSALVWINVSPLRLFHHICVVSNDRFVQYHRRFSQHISICLCQPQTFNFLTFPVPHASESITHVSLAIIPNATQTSMLILCSLFHLLILGRQTRTPTSGTCPKFDIADSTVLKSEPAKV